MAKNNKPDVSFVSPNEMFEAAKAEMIGGKDPTDDMAWMLLINFVTVNIHHVVTMTGTKLWATLVDCPLEESTIEFIVNKHLEDRAKQEEIDNCLCHQTDPETFDGTTCPSHGCHQIA